MRTSGKRSRRYEGPIPSGVGGRLGICNPPSTITTAPPPASIVLLQRVPSPGPAGRVRAHPPPPPDEPPLCLVNRRIAIIRSRSRLELRINRTRFRSIRTKLIQFKYISSSPSFSFSSLLSPFFSNDVYPLGYEAHPFKQTLKSDHKMHLAAKDCIWAHFPTTGTSCGEY